jgi:hypothetical protein
MESFLHETLFHSNDTVILPLLGCSMPLSCFVLFFFSYREPSKLNIIHVVSGPKAFCLVQVRWTNLSPCTGKDYT